MASTAVVKCVKIISFLFNILFFVTGCVLIGGGVWLLVAQEGWEGISEYSYMSVAYVSLVVGLLIVVLAFIGCCGAITENKIMLLVFFVFLLLIFLAEIGVGVAAYVMRREIDDKLTAQLEKKIPDQYFTHNDVKTAVDTIQKTFDCCGLYGINDWNTTISNVKNYIDESCCIKNKDHISYDQNCKTEPWAEIEVEIRSDANFLKKYFQKGCNQSIRDFLDENLWLMALFGTVFGCYQILGMVCAMMLYCVLRRAAVVV